MAGESARYISAEGLAALEAELHALETEDRRAIAERIRTRARVRRPQGERGMLSSSPDLRLVASAPTSDLAGVHDMSASPRPATNRSATGRP
jgi:hypothetical protein